MTCPPAQSSTTLAFLRRPNFPSQSSYGVKRSHPRDRSRHARLDVEVGGFGIPGKFTRIRVAFQGVSMLVEVKEAR